MIVYVIESSVCMMVSLACYYLFFSRGKYFYFNRAYLLFTLILSLSIPIIEVDTPYSYSFFDVDQFHVEGEAVAISDNLKRQSKEDLEQSEVSSFLGVTSVLLSVYLLGVLYMLYRYVKGLVAMRKIVTDSELVNLKSHRIVLMDNYSAPFSFLNNIFVNKSDYQKNGICETVWFHELVHVGQYHSLDILLVELLLVVFYFNPLVWIYRHALKLNHEYTADEKVTEYCPDLEKYANHLLQFAYVKNISFECSFNYLSTKKRLIMLTKSKNSKVLFGNKVALSTLVVLATVSMLSFTNDQKTDKIVNIDKDFTVLIDLGHGGKDQGATSLDGSINEVVIINAIGDQLKKLKADFNVIYTRENNQFPSLRERVNLANETKADLLLSLHVNQNKKNENLSGIEVYYSDLNIAHQESKNISETFAEKLEFRDGSSPGIVKKAGFIVLKNSICPSVLLNLGFITNKEDLDYLMEEKNQRKLAKQIFEIIEQVIF